MNQKTSNQKLIQLKFFSAYYLIHNCLELTHQIFTDPAIDRSGFKGSEIISALTTIRRTDANPKVLARECVCAPRLKGINTFPQTEVVPADKKSKHLLLIFSKMIFLKQKLKRLFLFSALETIRKALNFILRLVEKFNWKPIRGKSIEKTLKQLQETEERHKFLYQACSCTLLPTDEIVLEIPKNNAKDKQDSIQIPIKRRHSTDGVDIPNGSSSRKQQRKNTSKKKITK